MSATSEQREVLRVSVPGVQSVSFSPDGLQLVAGTWLLACRATTCTGLVPVFSSVDSLCTVSGELITTHTIGFKSTSSHRL